MDALSPEAAAKRGKLRILFAAILVLIFFSSLGYVLIKRPQLPVTVILIVLSGVAAAVFAAYFIPNKLSERAKRAVTVGVAAVGVITTLLAPVINAGGLKRGTQQSPTPSASPPSSPSPPSSEPEPLSANLRPAIGYGCEGWIVENSLLKSVPDKGEDLNAQWVYEHGGASLPGTYVLTVRGNSEDAVIIDGLHIVDFKSQPTPTDASVVLPCTPYGGAQDVRYFEVLLDKQPHLIARPGEDPGTGKKTESAVKFPYRVSRSEPEYFQLWVHGPPCVCSWEASAGLDKWRQVRKKSH